MLSFTLYVLISFDLAGKIIEEEQASTPIVTKEDI